VTAAGGITPPAALPGRQHTGAPCRLGIGTWRVENPRHDGTHGIVLVASAAIDGHCTRVRPLRERRRAADSSRSQGEPRMRRTWRRRAPVAGTTPPAPRCGRQLPAGPRGRPRCRAACGGRTSPSSSARRRARPHPRNGGCRRQANVA
jgi:hypothetical protein